MKMHRKGDREYEVLYLAGERVPPGIYRQIGGSRELRVEQEDLLPASLDGSVACYERVEHRWGHRSSCQDYSCTRSDLQSSCPPPGRRDISAIQVLICTDSGVQGLFLQRTMERAGHIVAGWAKDGASAVELSRSCDPDLILMDIDLCDRDGFQSARQITDRRRSLLLLLSDRPLAMDDCGAFPGGAHDYLQKPFTGDQLLHVTSWLATQFQTL
ncbi:MAG: hypothetical protein JWN14_3264 [Chthonomonadales bacterium]|nr:hypothetical protein [Chthonomonadales bacterium]